MADGHATRRSQDGSGRLNAIALPSAGGAQRASFWQNELLKPPSETPPDLPFWQFHVLEAMSAAAPHLERFGGHAQAAGLEIRAEEVANARAAIEEKAKEMLKRGVV